MIVIFIDTDLYLIIKILDLTVLLKSELKYC
jgi:hypothetical protein